MELKPTTRNVTRVYRLADDDEVSAGAQWYDRARRMAAELDPSNVERGAAVIATLSPLVSWKRNVELARQAYALPRHDQGLFLRGMPTLLSNANKVWHILTSDQALDRLVHGPKVRAFWSSILDPTTADVVVDRHAFDVSVGQVTSDELRGLFLGRKGGMRTVATCYLRAADRLGVPASQVQAVTWIYWRRHHAAHQAAHQRGAWG